MIELRLENGVLDIKDDFSIEFKIINNLFSINKLQSDYTFPSTLPTTPNNNRLLGSINRIEIGEKVFSLSVDVYFNQNQHYRGRIVYTEGSEDHYKFSVLVDGDSVEFMNKSLRDIDWGKISAADFDLSNFDHSQAYVPNRLFVFPPTDIGDYQPSLPVLSPYSSFNAFDYAANEYFSDTAVLPSVVISEMIKRFLAHFNFSLSGNFPFSNVGGRMHFPTDTLVDNVKAVSGTLEANKDNVDTGVTIADYTVQFFDEIQDDLDAFDSATGLYTCKFPGLYVVGLVNFYIEAEYIGSLGNKDYTLIIDVMAGEDVLLTDTFNGSVGETDQIDNTTVNLGPTLFQVDESMVGTQLYVRFRAEGEDFKVEFSPRGGQFIVHATASQQDPDDVSALMPDKTLSQFLEDYAKVFPLGVYLGAYTRELRIDFEPQSATQSYDDDWSDFAAEKYIHRTFSKGYKLNYSYPDLRLPAASSFVVFNQVLNKIDLEQSGAFTNQVWKVKSTNELYKLSALPPVLDNWELVAKDEDAIIIGDGSEEIKSNFYPLPMVNTSHAIVLPQPKTEFVSLFLKENNPQGGYDIQLGIFSAAAVGKSDQNTTVTYPLASPYNYDAVGNQLAPFNLWYHDAEGLFEYRYKKYLADINGEEVERFFLLPQEKIRGKTGAEIIRVHGIHFRIKEIFVGFTQHYIKAVKAKLLKTTPNG